MMPGMLARFQRALLGLKRLSIPVIAASFGMTLGAGVELALAADRVVAAAETYMGHVESGAGLVPAGGGCKEMLLRALEGLHGDPAASTAPPLVRAFETITIGKVSGSAKEARELGFLRGADVVVPNVENVLYVAKETAMALDAEGYAPPAPARLPVLGPETRAQIEMAAERFAWGGPTGEHDLKIAGKLAYVLAGGDLPTGDMVEEEHFLDLEREAFLSLCGEPATLARMEHFVRTGRPLRN